jgi:hypothetical protein
MKMRRGRYYLGRVVKLGLLDQAMLVQAIRDAAIAFKYAEEHAGYRLPRYSGYEFQEAAGAIARGEEAKIGKRACGFRNRIARHVLSHFDFDNDDTEWLCTTISAFLFITESSIRRENRLQTS